MNKEEVLQKVNDYCNEKSYTVETLTDGFKDKFAEHFAKRYPDATADDEQALGELKFALNTAFSGASSIITEKTNSFTSKENEYKSQIAELTKKLGNPNPNPNPKPNTVEIPQEVQEQLDEFKKFKNEEAKKSKFNEIIKIAKKSVRQDLHKSFETFAQGIDVSLDKDDKEQADTIVTRFQEIFKDTIGDIKPLAPQQKAKVEEELIASVPKITL